MEEKLNKNLNAARWNAFGLNWLSVVNIQDFEKYLEEVHNIGILEFINKGRLERLEEYFEFSGWTQDDEYVEKTTFGQFGFADKEGYDSISKGAVLVERFDKLLDTTGEDRVKMLKWIELVSS